MGYDSRTGLGGSFRNQQALPQGDLFADGRYQGASSDGSSGTGQPNLTPGLLLPMSFGRVFMYVEATAALAEGDVVQPVVTESWLLAQSGLSMSADRLSLTGFSSLKVNQWRNGFVMLTVATGTGAKGQTRRIVGNTATVVYLDEPFNAAGTSITASLFNLNRVGKTIVGIWQPVTGVSLGTIPAPTGGGWYGGGVSYYGWIQVQGLCPQVAFTGAVTTVGAGENSGVTNSATVAGTADIVTATPDASAVNVFGTVPQGISNVTPVFAPVFLNKCTY